MGTIGIADGDEVDLTNLQRQIIHHTPDVGRPKVLSAKEKIHQINPDVKVITYQTRVDSQNILEIMKDYDVVMDGTDNFAAKFLINDAAVMAGKIGALRGFTAIGGLSSSVWRGWKENPIPGSNSQ